MVVSFSSRKLSICEYKRRTWHQSESCDCVSRRLCEQSCQPIDKSIPKCFIWQLSFQSDRGKTIREPNSTREIGKKEEKSFSFFGSSFLTVFNNRADEIPLSFHQNIYTHISVSSSSSSSRRTKIINKFNGPAYRLKNGRAQSS